MTSRASEEFIRQTAVARSSGKTEEPLLPKTLRKRCRRALKEAPIIEKATPGRK